MVLARKKHTEISDLVDNLKQCCFANGKEKGENLTETAAIFHKLQQLLKKYSDSSDNIHHLFLRRIGLLNASLVRNPIDSTTESLNVLCREVLLEANANDKNADLVAFSVSIKFKIETMRNDLRGKYLNRLNRNKKQISVSAVQDSVFVPVVKQVQIFLTDRYTGLMREIADFCIGVLGDLPCKFVLFAMGSLPRKEVTPFSDLECAICLEDSLEPSKKQKSVNYFEWFAVLFQVILLNLGETIIPCLDIPVLKEHFPNYFDDFTHRGISLDGMVSHARKSPLHGLIKPVTQMADLIDIDVGSVEKAGDYHLADMLVMPCFVAGDKNVYDEYINAIEKKIKKIKSGPNHEEYLQKRIDKLEQNYSIPEKFENYSQTTCFNVKDVMYRPLSLYISLLGRMYSIKELSSFDIISKLFSRSSRKIEEFHSAIALVCYVRLIIYSLYKSQNDIVCNTEYDSKLIQVVGLEKLVAYFVTTKKIQNFAKRYRNLDRSNFIPEIHHLILISFKQYEKALHRLAEIYCSNANSTPPQEISKIIAFCNININDFPSALMCYEKLLKVCGPENYGFYFKQIGVCKIKLHNLDGALQSLNISVKQYKNFSADKETDENIADVFTLIGTCNSLKGSKNRAKLFYKDSLAILKRRSGKENQENARKKIAKVQSLIGQCLQPINPSTAVKHYKRSLESLIGCDLECVIVRATCLYNIGLCYGFLNFPDREKMQYEQCIETLKEVEYPNHDLLLRRAKVYLIYSKFVERKGGHLKLCEINLKKIPKHHMWNENVAEVYRHLGLKHSNLLQAEKAIYLHQESIKIYRKLSNDATTDEQLAKVHYEAGCIFSKHSMADRAVANYETSLKIYQALSPPEMGSIEAAYCHLSIGHCNVQQGKSGTQHYKSAAKHLSLSSNDEINVNVFEEFITNSVNLEDKIKFLDDYIYQHKDSLSDILFDRLWKFKMSGRCYDLVDAERNYMSPTSTPQLTSVKYVEN